LLLSHCYHPIAVIKLPSLNAAIVVIKIITIGGGGSIIAIAVAFAIALSIIAAIAVIFNVVSPTLSTLLRHRHCCRAPCRAVLIKI
jgi:hypothetical protein